jgi:multimeric flavodoxin WrbA
LESNRKPKILGISGSPRKAATYKALGIAMKEVESAGAEIEIMDFNGKKFSLCTDCGRCIKEQSVECVIHNDDLTGWATRFPTYDGYIIASPVYDVNITAQLQGFFNRMRSNWLFLEKEPYFYSRKVGGAIAVGGTRYGGQELVLNALNNYYLSLGMMVVSAGPRAYLGAGVWSKDNLARGVEEDSEGIKSLKALGQAVVRSVWESFPSHHHV